MIWRFVLFFWIVTFLSLGILSLGCATPQPIAKPWPCDRIEDRPAVAEELSEMKSIHVMVFWKGLDPVFREPGQRGIYYATREWAVEMDAKCAADRALIGEADSRQEPSWWRRTWLGKLLSRPEK